MTPIVDSLTVCYQKSTLWKYIFLYSRFKEQNIKKTRTIILETIILISKSNQIKAEHLFKKKEQLCLKLYENEIKRKVNKNTI